VLSQATIVSNIMQANPILEAFGNAKTGSTHNSSRFGKHIELCMNDENSLIGGWVRSYLLENVRVTSQQTGERNFHIFYQLVAGASAEERVKLHLTGSKADKHRLINQGLERAVALDDTTESVYAARDAAGYSNLKEHFHSLACKESDVESLMRIVAGLLHLGDINFDGTVTQEGEGSEVNSTVSKQSLVHAAELFSVSESELLTTLTVRCMISRGETFKKKLTVIQAINAKDALAKAIYKRAFDWVVGEINTKIRVGEEQEDDVASRIAILDVFGFDAFQVNNFEQLCINYANEILQQQFNQQIFKLELQEYEKECIQFDTIDFVDNQDTLELIHTLLFKTLDDQCKLPNPTDKRFTGQLYTVCSAHPKFILTSKLQRDGLFSIQHFAGPVVYSADNFIDKNLDELPIDALNLLSSSQNHLLSLLDGVQVSSARELFGSPVAANHNQNGE
jgi:myosin-5